MMQLMNMHRQDAHQLVAPAAAAPAPTAKLERLPRPVFSLNMTEATWEFTVIEWNSYIGQAVSTPGNRLLQLRAACDAELRKRVYDSGDYSGLDTEAKLLARMKQLAVIKIHKSVHLMNLYRMIQESDEAIRAFVARAGRLSMLVPGSVTQQSPDIIPLKEYVLLHNTVKSGVPEDKSAWDSLIQDYYQHRHSLVTSGPVDLLHDRPVIPRSLRDAVMSHIEETPLILIELPEVLHQLHGVLWCYQVVGGEPDPPRPDTGYGLSLDSGTRQNKSLNH